MKTKFFLITPILLFMFVFACKQETKVEQNNSSNSVDNQKAKVTFIELGSVNFIPCKQMQPVMKSIESKYKGKVKVVFYDVWKDNKPAKQYGINLIPTQVFLDESEKEFFRHEGFFAEEEIDKLLSQKGITLND